MIEIIRQCLPTYKVTGSLGEGIYGAVYRIEDGLKTRAVKVVPLVVERSRLAPSGTEMDSKISQDFHAVQQYYEKIEGMGVMKIHDFHLVGKEVTPTQARGYLVIMMELCPKNLRDYVVDAAEGLPPARIIGLMKDLAQVLKRLTAECGETFLVTDLKPSNLLFTGSGDLVVGDLGGLKRLSSVSSTARAQFTPNWAAPETILKAEPARVPAIIYSFGLVSYFLWEGVLPYEEEDFIARLRLLRDQGVTFSRTDVPESIRSVISRCLSFEAEDRYADFAEVAQALSPLEGEAEKSPAEFVPRPELERESPGDRNEAAAEPVPDYREEEAVRERIPARPSRRTTNGPGRSNTRERSFTLRVCPSCGQKVRVARGASLSQVRCAYCEKPLSAESRAALFAKTVGLCLLGWILSGGVEFFMAQGELIAPLAVGWIPAGILTGFALRFAAPGFLFRHVLLVALGWSLGAFLARQTGEYDILLWVAGWMLGSFSTALAAKNAQPGFSGRHLFYALFLWTAGFVAGEVIFLTWNPSSNASANEISALEKSIRDAAQIGLIELFAAFTGLVGTFFLLASAQKSRARMAGSSGSAKR
ncbi:MAG: protein kinase [Deltaproteobacteria bacterium]|nr:protein kinase [Deltaproteobacteria bacterium]